MATQNDAALPVIATNMYHQYTVLRIWIRMFFGLRLRISKNEVRIRNFLLSSKISNKNLDSYDSYCFVTFLNFYDFITEKNDVKLASKK